MSTTLPSPEATADAPTGAQEATPALAIDTRALSRVFSAPTWLRDLGLLAWFLVGVFLVLGALVLILGLTAVIVGPVIVGGVLATVAGPLVTKLQAHRIPRAAGAGIVLLGLLAIGVVIVLLVLGGLSEQSDEIKASLSSAVDTIEGWVNDTGAGGTSGATESVKDGAANVGATFLEGLGNGIATATSFVFFLAMTLFSTFFLLKDGPTVRRFVDRHMGVPQAVATTITSNVMVSLRRYFLGLTFVAAFNAVIVGLAAWLLGVPLAGSIAVVVFATAYVPYIGAVVSGAFAVLITLSSQGTTAALIMLVVVLLANGLLQNIFEPIAFGATLDLNPLVVLIVTTGFGAIFGMVGLILAAPLTSAAIHISGELKAAKEAAQAETAPAPLPDRFAAAGR